MRSELSKVLLLVGLCCAGTALAQTQGGEPVTYGRGQGWSVLAAQTVGQGQTALVGQVGWPGISVGLLHGGAQKFDIGGKLTFNYGEEGIVTRVVPGLKLQAWMRLMLLETQRLGVGVSFAPGPFFYFRELSTKVGLSLPVNLVVGVPIGSALMFNAGLDFPFYVTFGTGGGAELPVLAGAGLENFNDRSLAVTFNTRLGTSLFPVDERLPRDRSLFTLEATFGVAYRM